MKTQINSNFFNNLLSSSQQDSSYKYRVTVSNKETGESVVTMYMNTLNEMSNHLNQFYKLFNFNRSSFTQNVYVGRSNTPLDAMGIASISAQEAKNNINSRLTQSFETIQDTDIEEELKNLLLTISSIPNISISRAAEIHGTTRRTLLRRMEPYIQSGLVEVVSIPRSRVGGLMKTIRVKVSDA